MYSSVCGRFDLPISWLQLCLGVEPESNQQLLTIARPDAASWLWCCQSDMRRWYPDG
jgi:hypothetical protein